MGHGHGGEGHTAQAQQRLQSHVQPWGWVSRTLGWGAGGLSVPGAGEGGPRCSQAPRRGAPVTQAQAQSLPGSSNTGVLSTGLEQSVARLVNPTAPSLPRL